jgi:hypothetical protein
MSGRRLPILGWSALAALGVVLGLLVLRGERAAVRGSGVASAAGSVATALDASVTASVPGPPVRPPRAAPPAPVTPTEPVRQLPRVIVERGVPAPAGAFSGRVVSATTGEGVRGAEVTLAAPSGAASLVTDEAGRFEFRPAVAGTYQVAAVRAEGFLPFGPEWGRSPIALSAVPGVQVKDVIIALTPAPELVVQVLSASGAPVSGAAVRVLTQRAGETVLFPAQDRFTSDERGEVRFTAPEGSTVEARHPAHGVARVRVGEEAVLTRRLELRLPSVAASAPRAEARLSGRVLAPDGSGASGALVSVASAVSVYPRVFGQQDGYQSISGADGSFTLEELEPGLYDVSAHAAGFAPARSGDVSVPASGLVLRLAAGAVLTGRVMDERGAPIPAFVVNVLALRGPLEQLPFAQARFIDAQGRYEFRGLTAGRYSVHVAAAGFAPAERQLEVAEGAQELRADVVLAEGARLQGRVLSAATRAPIAGARVMVEGLSRAEALAPLFDAVSAPDGSFLLEGMPLVDVSLSVSAPGHNTRIVSGVRAGPPVVVELTPQEADAGPRIELVGIGAVLRSRGDALVVGEVVAGGGAQAAGLVAGDEILHIDGVPVVELGFPAAIQRIRGPEGTQVLLGVRRAGQPPVTDMSVIRKKIGT